MERLTYEGPDHSGPQAHPGAHESWRELAEHSVEHDQLSGEVPDPCAYARFVAWRREVLGLTRTVAA